MAYVSRKVQENVRQRFKAVVADGCVACASAGHLSDGAVVCTTIQHMYTERIVKAHVVVQGIAGPGALVPA